VHDLQRTPTVESTGGRDVRTSQADPQLPASARARIPRPASDARAQLIFDGVWALTLPLCYTATANVNAYLLKAEGGWILVDCGSSLEPGWDGLMLALERAGIAPDGIELLVVTHSHSDHRGLAAGLVDATGCGFAMGPPPHPQIDVLRDPAIPLASRRARAKREGVPAALLDILVDEIPSDDCHYRITEPVRVLHAGEQLQTSVGTWEVIPAPGHSADQIVLWNARHRVLIGSDLALPGPPSFLEYGTRPDPHADQLASLTRAIELEPRLLLSGHGRTITDAGAALVRCHELVRDRLGSVQATLSACARSAWDVVELVRPANATVDYLQRILSETLCVLEHLAVHDRAFAEIDDDCVRRWRATGPAEPCVE
jgi:glyoxylase-like metal-dependent hydrolase (beta-lactamase superfamily II)